MGRFDKSRFKELENTVILGEEEGLFALINSVSSDTDKKMLEIVSSPEYINEKTENTIGEK